jgi:hypothetical protein
VAGDEFPVGLLPLRLLTIECLSQAPRLGGLHRTSRIHFRASFFTPTVHPVGATAQRLGACLVQAPEVFPHSISVLRGARFPLIPSARFVAHSPLQLLLQLSEDAPVGALSDDLLGGALDHPGLMEAAGASWRSPGRSASFGTGVKDVVARFGEGTMHHVERHPL